jgi:hypothetical protein
VKAYHQERLNKALFFIAMSAPLMRIESLIRATARQMVPAEYVVRLG